MANITAAKVTNSTPVIVAQSALRTLSQRIQLARLVNRNYDTDVALYGQTINVTKRGALTVNDKAADATITLQNPADSKVTVTLDKHKEVSFIIEDTAKAFAKPDVLDGYTSDAADRIAEQIDRDISTLFAGFSQSVGTAGTDLTRTTITSARQTLTTGLAPENPRNLIITPGQEQALLDTDGFSFANYVGGDQAFRQGNLGMAFGFNTWVNTQLPNGAGSPAGKVCFAMHPDAITLVMRSLPMNEAPGVYQATVQDPQTGVVLRSTVSYSTDYLGLKVTLDVLYGVAELRDSFGVRVLAKD